MKIEFSGGGYLSIDRIITESNHEMVEVTTTIDNNKSGIRCVITKENALRIAEDIMGWFNDEIEPDKQNETVLQSEE